MRVIIAGSRTLASHAIWGQWQTITSADRALVQRAVTNSGFTITEVVSGCARGIDSVGALWGWGAGHGVKTFPADWERGGRGAGYARNLVMARYADALIALHDGISKGTAHMIRVALDRKLPVYVLEVAITARV